MGVLAALWEVQRSGRGQVVDAAIVDGASSLTALLHGLMAAGQWVDRRCENSLATGGLTPSLAPRPHGLVQTSST